VCQDEVRGPAARGLLVLARAPGALVPPGFVAVRPVLAVLGVGPAAQVLASADPSGVDVQAARAGGEHLAGHRGLGEGLAVDQDGLPGGLQGRAPAFPPLGVLGRGSGHGNVDAYLLGPRTVSPDTLPAWVRGLPDLRAPNDVVDVLPADPTLVAYDLALRARHLVDGLRDVQALGEALPVAPAEHAAEEAGDGVSRLEPGRPEAEGNEVEGSGAAEAQEVAARLELAVALLPDADRGDLPVLPHEVARRVEGSPLEVTQDVLDGGLLVAEAIGRVGHDGVQGVVRDLVEPVEAVTEQDGVEHGAHSTPGQARSRSMPSVPAICWRAA